MRIFRARISDSVWFVLPCMDLAGRYGRLLYLYCIFMECVPTPYMMGYVLNMVNPKPIQISPTPTVIPYTHP